VFTGNFELPKKAGEEYIVVRGSSTLPQGRIVPGARALPLVRTTNLSPAVRAAPGAHHWRLVGLEIATTHATRDVVFRELVELGTSWQALADVPHHIVLDRCFLHGTPTGNVRRGIALNSAHTAVLASYLSDFHEVGNDSQAIAGWNGPGPFSITDNYLEGAGENFMLGGADPSIEGLVPADLEFRGNHLAKPLSWRIEDPSYAGIPWTVKNIFELKNAERVLVDGNLMENNWAHAQNGYSILFTPRNQEGTAPFSAVRDVTFTNNTVRNVANGMNILSRDEGRVSQPVERVVVRNNIFVVDASLGGGTVWQHLTRNAAARDVVIERNTAIHIGDAGPGFMRAGYCCNTVVEGWRFTDNIVTLAANGLYGDDQEPGTGVLDAYFHDWSFTGNVLVSPATGSYPAGNTHVGSLEAIGFVDPTRGDFRLSRGSPWYGVAGAE
jgi:hypothetical protein